MANNYDIIVNAVDKTKGPLGQVEKNLKRVDEQAKKVNKELNDKLKSAGAAAGVALAALAAKTVMYANAIVGASKATDVSVNSVLALSKALATNGGEANKARDAVLEFSKKLGEASIQASGSRDAFEKLGISLTDIRNLSSEDLLKKTVDALAAFPDRAQAAKIQADLFGDALKGVDAKGFAQDFKALAASQSQAAAAFGSINTATDKLGAAVLRLQERVAVALKPFADAINKLPEDKLDKIIDAIVRISLALAGLAASAKVLSVLGTIFGSVAAYVGMVKLGLFSLNKTLLISVGYVSRFARGVGMFAASNGIISNMVTLFVKLAKRLPFIIAGLGRLALGVTGLGAVAWAANEVIAALFGVDLINIFIEKVKAAYDWVKKLIGLGGDKSKQLFLDPNEVASETQRLLNRGKAAATTTTTGPAANESLEALQKNLTETTKKFRELAAAAYNTKGDLNLTAMAFAEASSAAESLGIVLAKPAELISRDFSIAMAKANEEIRQQQMILASDVMAFEKWNTELEQSNMAIYEQSLRLSNAQIRAKQFAQELANTNLQILETRYKLADANYQQDVFSQTLIQSRQATEQQQITLQLLNQAFAAGTISLSEYVKMMSGLDSELLGVNERMSQVSDAVNKQNKMMNIESQVARKLTEQLQSGAMSWRDYQTAMNSVNSDGVKAAMIDVEAEIYRAKTVAEIMEETFKSSSKAAGDALAKNLADGLMKGKVSLSSFSDFVNSVLDDILQAVIQKQITQPMVSGIMGLLGGAGGGMGGSIFDLFSGSGFGFANGGYPPVNQTSLVGERGPELFVPNAAGKVIPNDQLNNGSGVNVNFTINAIDTRSGVEFLLQNKPQIIGMVSQAMNQRGKQGITG